MRIDNEGEYYSNNFSDNEGNILSDIFLDLNSLLDLKNITKDNLINIKRAFSKFL